MLDYVNADLNYLARTDQRPVVYVCDPPQGVPRRPPYAVHRVTIYNARLSRSEPCLERQGFALTPHESPRINFYDQNEVREKYYPAIETLVAQVTGACRVFAVLHHVRSAQAGGDLEPPVHRVHNDYTPRWAQRWKQRLLAGAEATRFADSRFAAINVWQPIHMAALSTPLALCDARSVSQSDLVASDLKFSQKTVESYNVTFNPAHRWFYFPEVQTDEALLIKCFDSAEDGRARFTPHSAFDDPTAAPAGLAPRESIEVHTFAMFQT
ncbi:MAG: methyltransferase [Alphaproteobacteria bacterium]|nr:methyltransferase [Alphaproteobacteria bacterium]